MAGEAALASYNTQEAIVRAGVGAATDLWNQLDPGNPTGSWANDRLGERIFLAVARAQELGARASDSWTDMILREEGMDVTPEAQLVPSSLAGVASDGRPLDSLLLQPLITTSVASAGGATSAQALLAGLGSLTRIVGTQIQDASRAGTSVGVAVRPRTGYVRMVNPGACGRCVILAGRFYKWSAGFDRHPLCGCRNIPRAEDTNDDIRTDADAYIKSLSDAELDKSFGKAGAQAIRDGADPSRVVNARRKALGLSTAGLTTTTELTSARGGLALRRGEARLMPESIYKLATDREDALRLLTRYGYVR